jgi:adenosine deaminase
MNTLMNKCITAMLTCIWFNAYADINTYFEQHIKKSPTELHAFLKQMPTGGELHFHLAGAAYAEHILKISKQNNWCINPQSFEIDSQCSFSNKKKQFQKINYEKMLEAWSMKKFDYSKQIGAEHFFNTFFKFMPVVIKNSPELLTEVIQRAARQNELYLEIMIIPDDAKSLAFGKDIGGTINTIQQFNASRQKLLSIPDFQKNINFAVLRTKKDLAKAKKLLGCHKSQSKTCQLEVKFQYYLLREVGVKAFFSEAVTALKQPKSPMR